MYSSQVFVHLAAVCGAKFMWNHVENISEGLTTANFLKAWHLAVSKFPSQVWRSDVAIILDSIQYGSRFTSRMWSLWLKTKRYRRNSVNFEPLFLMLTILMRGLLCSNDDSNWVDLFILISDIPIDISRLHPLVSWVCLRMETTVSSEKKQRIIHKTAYIFFASNIRIYLSMARAHTQMDGWIDR